MVAEMVKQLHGGEAHGHEATALRDSVKALLYAAADQLPLLNRGRTCPVRDQARTYPCWLCPGRTKFLIRLESTTA